MISKLHFSLKRMSLILTTALCITSFGMSGTAFASENTKTVSSSPSALNQDARIQDVEKFFSLLEAGHKDFYHQTSKEEFENEKEKLIQRLPNMTDQQFYYEICRLTAKVGDAHTSANYTGNRYEFIKGLPFAVSRFDDGWRLVILDEAHREYLGWKLTAIEGVDIGEIYKRAAAIISHDNDTWLAANFSNTINYADALFYLRVLNQTDTANLTAEGPDGQSVTFTISSFPSYEAISSATLDRVRPGYIPGTLDTKGQIYRYEYLPDGTLFLQYNSCQEDPNNPVSSFTDQLRAELRQTSPMKVIVDLRNNSGGNSQVFEPVIAMLGEEKERLGFELYTFIGPTTYSSGVMNAVQLQHYAGAILVGRPTGGSVNGFGELKYFTLDSLPITVYYSTKYFEMVSGHADGSLVPDIKSAKSYENYVIGIDEEIEAITLK